jgi:hypothetical protein
MSEGLVAHLVWAPLGEAPLARFLDSYERHEAGAPHRLLLVLKEFRRPTELETVRRRLAGVEHEELVMPERRLDIAAYARIAADFEAPWFYFLNSNSELLDDGWLGKPLAHLERPDVGLVSATASYEAAPASLPRRLLLRGSTAPFPNPHVRTNAFLLERDLARTLDWGAARSKASAWAVENGPRSLTRQVLSRGLEPLVVGRDGVGYPRERWRDAGAFRSGSQANLLVADNRTRQFADAAPSERGMLARLAWGSA